MMSQCQIFLLPCIKFEFTKVTEEVTPGQLRLYFLILCMFTPIKQQFIYIFPTLVKMNRIMLLFVSV